MDSMRDFNWVLNKGHFDRLVYGTMPNLFIFDCGTFIDLENYYYEKGQSGKKPAEILGRLEHHLVVTPSVVEEVEKHREMMINRRFEISEATAVLVQKFHEDYPDFEEFIGVSKMKPSLRDYHRYKVYLAGHYCFVKDSRKGEKDIISSTDIEMISTALDMSFGCIDGNPIGSVNILSPDEHIARTVHFLKSTDDFKKYKVRVIPTRNDLRSYLTK